jgi:acetoin utilization protein AcuB
VTEANQELPTVGDFMTFTPCTADEGLGILDAQDRMNANNIRHLLVTRNDHLVGVVSSRDVTFALSLPEVKPEKLTVFQAMTTAPFTCGPRASLAEVCKEMEAHRYGCAVIVEDGLVTGIFTTTDALRAVRALATGEKAEPMVRPTHIVDQPKVRPHVGHSVRLGDIVGGHGAMPSAKQGMITGTGG